MVTKKSQLPSPDFTQRICNLVPSRDTHRDWSFKEALSAKSLAAPAALPKSVDLRKPWWTINDQLTTGSCVGWAVADGVMRYLLVQAGRLATKALLSPRYVWMASKETDEFTTRPGTFIEEAGTSLKSAMDIARNYGVALETNLPFNVNTLMYPGDENAFYAEASTRRAANYFNLRKDTEQWKTWLATTGPILVGLIVDNSWLQAAQAGGRIDTFDSGSVRGGHAVCVVGYTADRFIVRNSWGTSWGDKGYGYVSAAYIRDSFFEESYGVTL